MKPALLFAAIVLAAIALFNVTLDHQLKELRQEREAREQADLSAGLRPEGPFITTKPTPK